MNTKEKVENPTKRCAAIAVAMVKMTAEESRGPSTYEDAANQAVLWAQDCGFVSISTDEILPILAERFKVDYWSF